MPANAPNTVPATNVLRVVCVITLSPEISFTAYCDFELANRHSFAALMSADNWTVRRSAQDTRPVWFTSEHCCRDDVHGGECCVSKMPSANGDRKAHAAFAPRFVQC
jgi:hypothetical protein